MKTSLETSSSLVLRLKLPFVVKDGTVLMTVCLMPEQLSPDVV